MRSLSLSASEVSLQTSASRAASSVAALTIMQPRRVVSETASSIICPNNLRKLFFDVGGVFKRAQHPRAEQVLIMLQGLEVKVVLVAEGIVDALTNQAGRVEPDRLREVASYPCAQKTCIALSSTSVTLKRSVASPSSPPLAAEHKLPRSIRMTSL